ncbi:MAG TPA: Hsp20/alpha crystallin family protein [Chloroflexota bacterium]|nr:Hsp20/alpha crystallin family protein [Chloroflexota bacterium]
MRDRNELFGRQGESPTSAPRPMEQRIPVNVYETEGDVVVIAPMPGVEAEDIDVEVLGQTVTLRARLRGPGQEARRYVRHEWSYGPYERTVELPIEVDADHANASHGNGVLVLSFPKALSTRSIRIPLQQITAGEALHQGHSGHNTIREGLPDQREY